jgi:hypothetical protein
MGKLSSAYLLLGAPGRVPGLGELFVLLFALGTAAAVLPAVPCFLGGRRTSIIRGPFTYVLAVLVGAPAGAAGAYVTMLGLDQILHLGLGKSLLTVILISLPGLFVGGGLVPFGIARLLTRANDDGMEPRKDQRGRPSQGAG